MSEETPETTGFLAGLWASIVAWWDKRTTRTKPALPDTQARPKQLTKRDEDDPLAPTTSQHDQLATEEVETEVVAPPAAQPVAPPPPPAAHLSPDLEEPPEPPIKSERAARICMDFGTSACAVAAATLDGEPTLANLSQIPGQPQMTVRSVFAIPTQDGNHAVLGDRAEALQSNKKVKGDYAFHRSLKRMLSDGRADENSGKKRRRALRAVIQELLLLAMAPEHSGTLASLEADPTARATRAKELGIPGFQLDDLPRHGLELYLSVPNAFGSYECEVIRKAATDALQDTLAFLARTRGWTQAPVTAPPRMIREAEAVVWWELKRKKGVFDPQRWLVFDVGGGSTDAAIVQASRPGARSFVESIAYSGVTFGGNDIDELLVKQILDRMADPEHERLGKLMKQVGGTSRLALLFDVETTKGDWSEETNRAIGGDEPELDEKWTSWLSAVLDENLDKEAQHDDITHDQGVFDLRPALPSLKHPQFRRPLAAFIRATVRTVIDDLFSDGVTTIDRVVVSGRGSLLPGVKQALTMYLLKIGAISDASAVAEATQDVAGETSHMKLACVRGICNAAAFAQLDKGLTHFVSQEVTYQLGELEPIRVWPARMRLLPSGFARAAIRLGPDASGAPIFFSQRRFPSTIVRYFPGSSRWSRRLIGSIRAPRVQKQRDFLLYFDCKKWSMQLWELRNNGPRDVGEMVQHDPPGLTNPVTGLPFGWGDDA
ncbi:MAG: hypothetical protein GY913_03630 [Proteobacteria bacterium]|nr:hypothetical protein [Pseudomonadota bacterium]